MGDMELDDDEYDESDGDESDAEEGEVRAPRMKTVGAQTGGVREAGKKVKPRTTRVQRLGDATARLRVMTPFFQLVDMRDHMRQLLATYAALSAAKHSDELEVVKGTKIKEVPEAYLATKKELLENVDLNRPDQIRASLAAFEEKWRRLEQRRAQRLGISEGQGKGKKVSKGVGSSYAQELMGTILSCLNALASSTNGHGASDLDFAAADEEDLAALIADPVAYLDADVTSEVESGVGADVDSDWDADSDAPDLVHMARSVPATAPLSPVASATPKTRPVGLPEWATGYLNFRGLVPLSPSHFYGTAAFNGSVTDVLLDTGGSRTMMDVSSAKKLGLPI